MLKRFIRRCAQNGQVLVFYALMIPISFLLVGAAADFGWLYFNQSRLQNAADAAVVAGAEALHGDEQNLSDYSYSTFINNYDEDFRTLVDSGVISKRDISDGDKVAKKYAIKNLSSDVDLTQVTANTDITDSWNNDATVGFNSVLYGVDVEDYRALYYVVTLDEELEHLFNVMNYFNISKLHSKVMAVAKIEHVVKGISLYQQMRLIEKAECYATWDHIKHEYDLKQVADYKPILGVGNSSDAARARTVQARGNTYIEGTNYRTETLTMHGKSKAVSPNGGTTGKVIDQTVLDSLFIDFKVDVGTTATNIKKDWDVILGLSDEICSQYQIDKNFSGGYNLDVNNQTIKDLEILSLRIHDLINIGTWNGSTYTYDYKIREGKEPDPLYVYIENENIYSHEYQSTKSFNAVHQLIINVNAANTDESKDRPVFFFYDGPEKIDGKVNANNKSNDTWNEIWRESWKYPERYKDNVRNSLPVIVNLNADFRGVLFFPNSPVVINGNGHNFEGIIVAQSFTKLKTEEEFDDTLIIDDVECTKEVTADKDINYVVDNDGTKEIKYTYKLITQEKSNLPTDFIGKEKDYVDLYPMYIDEKGNVQYSDEELNPTLDPDDTMATFNARDEEQLGKDKYFDKSLFNLASSTYNGFSKIAMVDYKYLDSVSADNIFITDRSDWVQ